MYEYQEEQTTKSGDDTQSTSTELDTTYQMHVLNMMDSINNLQVVNMILLCVIIGVLLGGALWKNLRP